MPAVEVLANEATSDPTTLARVSECLNQQGLPALLGFRILAVRPGHVLLGLPHAPHLIQQLGSFHGGAIGALADTSAGCAALTLMPPDQEAVTVEYKINFLQAFVDGELRASCHVVKAGKRMVVATSEVFHVPTGTPPDAVPAQKNLCAIMQATLTGVPRPKAG